MTGKQLAFGWYGGKFSHLNWLLPLLPQTTHYCEPFGGSAAVLLNRPLNIYVVTFREFALGVLILLGETGRVKFLDQVGQELDRGESAFVHREAWAELLKRV